MTNRLKFSGASAAALAAFTLLAAPASHAQRPDFPSNPPSADWSQDRGSNSWNGDDWRRDDWRRGDWRRDGAFFQRAQETCSRMAIEEAWRRGSYSAQYRASPQLVEGRRGPELRGAITVHNRKGLHTGGSVCELGRRGDALSFVYLR